MAREMKDSRIEWIGEIPKDWYVRKIKNISKNKGIKGFPDEQVLSLYRDFGIVIKSSRDDNHNRTSENTDNYKFVEPRDLVVNKMKAWQGSLAVSNHRGIVSPAYYVCTFTKEDILPYYIHYLLRSVVYLPEYRRLSGGIRPGQWDLSFENFRNIPVVVPPLTEQIRIAQFLDSKCSKIDETIEKEKEVIEKLKVYKQSVITEAVTKGLNPDIPMKDSGIKWIGRIPLLWEVGQAGKLLVGIKDGTHSSFKRVSSGKLLLSAKNVYNDGLRISENESVISEEDYLSIVKCGFPAFGDVLLTTIGGSIGRALVYTFEEIYAFQRSVIFLRPKHELLSPQFLVYLLLSDSLQTQMRIKSSASAQDGIYSNDIKRYYIPIPPLEEQKSIINYLNEKCSKIDSAINKKQKVIEKLAEYKKSLIYECVTGKREV